MIVNIGIDSADLARFAQMLSQNRGQLYRTLFCEEERAIMPMLSGEREISFVAGRWAAKEAVLKVLGTGIGPVALPEVGIFVQESGKPTIRLFGKALDHSQRLGIDRWHLSITHERGVATAFVIGESTP